MAHAILMPKPGQMTEECSIVAWHKQEGDPIHRGDVLFEIETDKSVMDVEAFDEGTLLRIVAPEGASVPVNSVCAWIGEPGEAIPEAPAPATPAASVPSPTPAPAAAPAVPASVPGPAVPAGATPAVPAAPVAPAGPAAGEDRRIAISPRASRLAAEAGVDPRTLTGSGPGGRIVERDVQAAMEALAAVAAVPSARAPAAMASGTPAEGGAAEPMSRMRRVIAERLTASWTSTPHFTVTAAVDVTELLAARARVNAQGAALSVTDFVLAATAATLAEFPDVNARTDGVSVWHHAHVQLGMAVSVPGGLVVAVIRDADRLTVAEMHQRAAALASAARDGTASVDELTGSTFTVSNLGMFGVDEFSAIINPGEAAILAVSSAVPTPVAVGNAVQVRSVMKLTLSADHRLVDGALGARFLQALRGRLEDAGSFDLGTAVAGASTVTASSASRAPATARRPDDPNWFDLVVLGAGTGGYTAAFRAAQLGLKVALVDADKIGGTCLHRGCIPTKAILESADLAHRVRETGRDLGVLTTGVAIDYAAVAANRDAVVRRMWTGLKSLVGKNGVEWVAGRGRLDGPGRVRVALHGTDGTPGTGGERVLEAADVILATGSRVKSLPGIVPDGVRILTSDDALRLAELPGSIVVVGAGAVGCEFASAFHDLGARVTLLEYLPAIAPLEDAEVSRELQRSFERRGIGVVTNARFDPASLIVGGDGIRLTVGRDGGEATEIEADCILIATGRAANTEDLGLETTRVSISRGVIEVDGWMHTAEPHVYAIGDLVGGLWLAHTAAHEGLIAVHCIAGETVEAMDYARQPRATYARPEIASIGLTEQQCAERGRPVAIGKVPFKAIAKAVIGGSREGFAKVIAHRDTGEVLGIHVIGAHATELIAEGSLAFTGELGVDVMGATTHPHPTLAEVLGEAAMAVRGRSINF
jgi:dihydrolipoyl dehydrogenase